MTNKHLFRHLKIKVCPKGLRSFAFSTLNFKFSSTFVEKPLQISPVYMQNEPNLPKAQMNVYKVLTKDYENKCDWTLGQNEPKTNPIYHGVVCLARILSYETSFTNNSVDICPEFSYSICLSMPAESGIANFLRYETAFVEKEINDGK
ncbi:MAG: hypothetical protein FVQ85_16725 [Planctomycetes bacterium]|nr:hypothetical protein [Planctomycetota bacterium]